MWLLSNSPKKNLKKFTNNWLAKAMGQKQNIQSEAAPLYKTYKAPVIDDVASSDEIKEILRRK